MEKNMRKCMCVCINTHFIKHTLTSWSSYLRVSTVSHGVCYCPLELRAHVQHALVFFVCLFCFYFFAFVFWACGILKGLPRWFSGKRICLPMQETLVWSLGWEDPLKEEMATPSSVLAWRMPMDRGAWRATFHGVTKSRTRQQLKHTDIYIYTW